MGCCFQPVHFVMLFTAVWASEEPLLPRTASALGDGDLAQSDLRSRQYHFNRAATSTSHVKKDGGLVAAGTESLVAMVTEITATSW